MQNDQNDSIHFKATNILKNEKIKFHFAFILSVDHKTITTILRKTNTRT